MSSMVALFVRISLGSLLFVMALGLNPGQASAKTAGYGITGNSNGTGWSFTLIADGGLICGKIIIPDGTVLPGGSPHQLAQAFVTAINDDSECQHHNVTAMLLDNGQFKITRTVPPFSGASGDFTLFVGDVSGDPESGCEVDTDGCSFNPTIVLLSVVPALSQSALIALVGLLAGATYLAIRRRAAPTK